MVMWIRVELVGRPPNQAHSSSMKEEYVRKCNKYNFSISVSKGWSHPNVKGAHGAVFSENGPDRCQQTMEVHSGLVA